MRIAIKTGGPRSGGALLFSLVAATLVAGLAAAAYTLSFAQTREVNQAASRTRALYVAEAGVSESIIRISGALAQSSTVPATIGTKGAPLEQRSGKLWCDVIDHANGEYTITSTGVANLTRRTLEAVIEPTGGGVFDYAIFAGNSSSDPNYALGLGGVGAQADAITGNVYSGGSVAISGDASVAGVVDATGTVSGSAGNEGEKRSLPNIIGMNYEANHDFDVATMFSSATQQSNALGGTAWQLPESSPAHIFRKNPDDRLSEINATAKDDFFLEDPYESLDGFTAPSGSTGQAITVSGLAGEAGASGDDKVYFIDGNLWIHNYQWSRMELANDAKVTFVVKGNVYFSDDIYVGDPSTSGVAFLAINDPNEADSGNIYLGDPEFGTLEYMQAFLYAENNFYDNNLDENGSATVTLDGNMTAGNHVDINRDFVDGDGNVQHSKLTVDFDNRISTGALVLPGIPDGTGGTAGFRIISWREVAN